MCHCFRKKTTTAITQCKLQYYVQPPLATPPPLQCMHSLYAPLLSGKTDHQCKLLWAWPSTSTLQTTACAKEYMRKMVEDKDHQSKLQRVKNYTATIGVHDAPSTCNLHKGMPLNFCPYPQFNGICPYASLHMFAASCTPMVAV